MPRYTKATAKAKAKYLAKSYIKNGFNQTRLAEQEGVTSQAINQRFKHTPGAQETLQQVINQELAKAGITTRKVYKRLDEQLDATRAISAIITPTGKQKDATGQTCDFVEVTDYANRDKAINKCLMLIGHLKQNGNEVKITNIIGSQLSELINIIQHSQTRSNARAD